MLFAKRGAAYCPSISQHSFFSSWASYPREYFEVAKVYITEQGHEFTINETYLDLNHGALKMMEFNWKWSKEICRTVATG